MADNAAVLDQGSPASSTTPRPRVVNSNIHTTDITTRFRKAAAKILPGTLVKDEHFTLFESVGALEVGDPKMDSGCTEDGESLEEEFDVCKPLNPSEVMWLMDELLSREVAWHMGYPLSQTLFTSVHIEKLLWPSPSRLQEAQFCKTAQVQIADPMLHKLFRSYCLGLIKSCDLVLTMVTSQHYYEEEDLATQLYNRDLLQRFSVEEILADMERALQCLDELTLDPTAKAGLEARMQFRSDFLSMLLSHGRAEFSPSSSVVFDDSLLQRIQETRNQGVSVPNAFTLKIQRRLASTVPPRPMVTIDEGRTLDYLTRFIRDSEYAFSVLCASHPQDFLTTYFTFCSQNPQPSVYIRALLQSWLAREDLVGGIANEFDFILTDTQSITLAASPIARAAYLNPDQMTGDLKLVKQHLREFFGKHGRSFLNIWRTACLNRCRVRRTLCHAAVEWDQIQAEAEDLDDELQRLTNEPPAEYPEGSAPTFSYSISSWVYHYKLIQVRLIVQMGFELEIYAPHELSSMYWYLRHVCDAHLAHLERISFFVSERERNLPSPSQRSSEDHELAEECRNSLRHLYRQFSLLKAMEATARGLHGLYTVLQRHGKFQQPATIYASDHFRYELRMRPFLYLSIPEPLGFEQCRRQSRMEVRNDSEILEEAVSHVIMAKKGWEEVSKAKWNAFPLRQDAGEQSSNIIRDLWVADVRGAAKATIGLGIAIATVQKHLQTTEGLERLQQMKAVVPSNVDKDYWHAWWLVPRLVS